MQFDTLRKFAAGLLALPLAQPSTFVMAQDKSPTHRELVNQFRIPLEKEPVLAPAVAARLQPAVALERAALPSVGADDLTGIGALRRGQALCTRA